MSISSRVHHSCRLASDLLSIALLLISLPSLAQSTDQADSEVTQAQAAKISHVEAFNPVVVNNGRSSIASIGSDAKQRLDVAAFGQSYRLELEQNTRIGGLNVSASTTNARRLLRGSINGKSDSWVRLSVSDTETQGLIWDGRDLYAVEPIAAVADLLTQPLTAPNTGSVIFRLADTEISLGPDFCGAQAGDLALSDNGLAEYQALSAELSRMQIAALSTATPTQGIEISALGDAAFRSQYGSNAEAQDAMLVRLNNLDGIFSAQVGMRMQAPTLTVYDNNPSTLSNSTDAGALLNSLATLRMNTASLRARGLTHLFTGRNLDGTTVGIAYVGALCSSRYGVALTESRTRGAWIDSLIAAHEIGHNLGAIHDGEGVCASTPTTYLMAPQITGSSSFSQCSLDKIFPTLQAASCIVAVDTPDPGIAADLGTVNAMPTNSFAWTLPVKNSGNGDATGLTVEVSFQPAITIEQSSVSGGSCISGAGSSTCTLDALAAGETRAISFTLRNDSVGSIAVSAMVSASADSNLANNAGSGTILIEPAADVGISLNAPASLELNASADVGFTLGNAGPSDATGIAVTLTLPTGITVQTLELTGGSCNIQGASALCNLGSLAVGANANGRINFLTAAEGAKQFQVSVATATVDPVTGNNSSTATAQTVATATTISSADHRGGGGLGWTLLGALFGLRWLKSRRLSLSG